MLKYTTITVAIIIVAINILYLFDILTNKYWSGATSILCLIFLVLELIKHSKKKQGVD